MRFGRLRAALLATALCLGLPAAFPKAAGAEPAEAGNAICVLGGDAVLRAGQEGASGAVWFMTGTGGLVPAAGSAVSSPVGGRLVSSLTVGGISQEDVGREYYCVFLSADGTAVSGPARIVCGPVAEHDESDVGDAFAYGTATDCAGVTPGSCAWLTAADLGTPEGLYLEGTGWYRVRDDGSREPVKGGGREIPCGRTLAVPDVTPEDSGAVYAYAVVNPAGSAETLFRITVDGSAPVSRYVGSVSLAMTPDGEIVSCEPSKYTVESFSVTDGARNGVPGTLYSVTVRADGGFKFRRSGSLLYGRIGAVPVVSEKESAAAELSTLTGFVPSEEKTAVSFETAYLSLDENGEAALPATDGVPAVSGLPAGAAAEGGILRAAAGGFSFVITDGPRVICCTVAPDEKEPAGERPRFLTEYPDGALLGEGYSFAVAYEPAGSVVREVGSVLGGLGLSVSADGVISGIPTEKGNFEFTLSLVSGEYTETGKFVLRISEKQEYYRITFVKNGGKGEMPPVTVSSATGYYVIPECRLTPPGSRTFSHWESAAGALLPGDEIRVTSDLALTAVWAEPEHVHSFRAKPSGNAHVLTCSCGLTVTEAHRGGAATCRARAKCEVCGAAYGQLAPHEFVDGFCRICGTRENASEVNGGKGGESTAPADASSGTESVTGGNGVSESTERRGDGTFVPGTEDSGTEAGTSRRIAVRREPDSTAIIVLLIFAAVCLAAGTVSLIIAKKR